MAFTRDQPSLINEQQDIDEIILEYDSIIFGDELECSRMYSSIQPVY